MARMYYLFMFQPIGIFCTPWTAQYSLGNILHIFSFSIGLGLLVCLWIQPIGAESYTSSWIGYLTWKLFFWALERLRGSFSDIRAHQDFEMPDLFMPQLLIKELWLTIAIVRALSSSFAPLGEELIALQSAIVECRIRRAAPVVNSTC